jgi:hypothetical protein
VVADAPNDIMEHRVQRTVSLMHAAAVRRSAFAAVVCVGLVGCGSSSADKATATALFRQIVEHQYDIRTGRCAWTAQSRWTCTAHVNDPGKEINVDVYGTVSNVDGTLSESGHAAVR